MDAATFLRTALVVEGRIASRPVAEHWDRPSALEGYTVGGLAGHLARGVLTVGRYLDRPTPGGDRRPTDGAGYIVRALGSHDPVASDLHRGVRDRGAQEASAGHAALVDRLTRARRELEPQLAAADPGQLVAVLDDTVLPLAAYLQTRLVELVVHLDDLAVSLDLDGPGDVPDDAYETVAALLARVAVRRVGALPTIRSLARRERHPDAVRAL